MAAERCLKIIKPVRLRAEVVHGFGRGSKELGFPTANLGIRWDAVLGGLDVTPPSDEERAVLNFATTHAPGIYCAFGRVEGIPDGGVHKVAMSMGWNPTFADVKAKAIEPWILHTFPEDFYGRHLRLLVVAYVRPELKFDSLDALRAEITADGEFCAAALAQPELLPLASDPFLLAGLSPCGVSGGGGVHPARPSEAGEPGLAPSPTASGATHVSCDLRLAMQKMPRLAPGMARLLLVRHGETVANERGYLCGGGNDSQLTPYGKAQAEQLGEELRRLIGLQPPALVASSPLSRARASADAIAGAFPTTARDCFEGLREMRYGSLEGSRISDVRGEMASVSRLWSGGETSARVGGEGGESPEDLAGRVLSTVRRIMAERRGTVVLLVCHSWVNKALIASVMPDMGLARMQQVPQRNCAVNVIDFSGEASGMALSDFRVLGIDLMANEARLSEGRL